MANQAERRGPAEGGNPRHLAAVAETHLDDLQAGMEAGSRHLDHIHDSGSRIREALMERQLEQAALMGSLMKRCVELKACLKQQHQAMRDLRDDIRRLRDCATKVRRG